MKPVPVERRSKRRFPLSLALTYVTLGRNPLRGSGRTFNISSSGLLISTVEPYSGHKAEFSIDWPCHLNGMIGLQLKITGILVRTDGVYSAFKIAQYSFRTCALKRMLAAS